jgi:hypothetical protein
LASIFSWKESILANISSLICSIFIVWRYNYTIQSSVQ